MYMQKFMICHQANFQPENKSFLQTISDLHDFMPHLTSGVLILIHMADAYILVVMCVDCMCVDCMCVQRTILSSLVNFMKKRLAYFVGLHFHDLHPKFFLTD